MYLSYTADVPSSEITHVIIYEEIVGLHIVCPAVRLTVAPSVTLPVYDKAAYEKLLHCARHHLVHTVQLHVALQYGAHGLTEFLLVTVSCRTGRFFRLGAVYAYHVPNKTSYKIVLQRNVALSFYVFLLFD